MNKRKSLISVRGGYGDISGIAPCNTEMQLYQFDRRTRMLLSNELFKLLKALFENSYRVFHNENADSIFCEDLISNVFIEPIRLSGG